MDYPTTCIEYQGVHRVVRTTGLAARCHAAKLCSWRLSIWFAALLSLS